MRSGKTTESPGALSLDEVHDFLSQVYIVEDGVDGDALTGEAGRAELEHYMGLHARSTQLSLAMIGRNIGRNIGANRRPRVLELGGAPYYFSSLMHHVFDAEMVAVNVEAGAWPGAESTRDRSSVTLAVPGTDDDRLDVDVRLFNIEKDPFPFEDDSFDVVLCMEVLEHLGFSPSHMLGETHRVLRPGGLFFLTVPNFINIKRTVSMLLNRRCQYPYSGYGIYGRHQREFAPGEVKELFEVSHFEMAEFRTANVWPTFRGNTLVGVGNAVLNGFSKLPLPWIENKREMIMCAARPVGEPVVAYPSWLYHHRHLYPEPPNGVLKSFGD